MGVSLREEQKEAESTIAELRAKVQLLELKTLDPTQFRTWNWKQIHFWIINVDDGRFKKYDAILREFLSKADLTGEELSDVNPLILEDWGIKDGKDRAVLSGHIRSLARQNGPSGNDVASAEYI